MESKFAVFDEQGRIDSIDCERELRSRLKEKTEEELRKQIAIHSVTVGNPHFLSGGEPSKDIKQAIAFFQMELDLRSSHQAEKLAKKTTWISGIMGALAAIIGALVGVPSRMIT